MLLDSRPSDPNRALQMETQYIPSIQATDAKGETYARIAPTSFPRGSNDESVLVHRISSYTRKALWDAVTNWFNGGAPASGSIDPQQAFLHVLPGHGGATWQIYTNESPKKSKIQVAWNSFATPMAADSNTFGYRWDFKRVTKTDTKNGLLATLPEYFHLMTNGAQKGRWVPVRAEEVPAETGLVQFRFTHHDDDESTEPYVTPSEPDSCWKKPGPVAGPFQAHLGDGSVVTYYWYRFADQPALLNADMSDKEREQIQQRVEKLHRHWKKDREYLPPPTTGRLAEIDPALIVTPPPGYEVGYVPIVTRQGTK